MAGAEMLAAARQEVIVTAWASHGTVEVTSDLEECAE
jgi:hypothetical protein